MSDESQQSDADGMASGVAPADSFSSNGSYPDAAVGIAEPAELPESATAGEAEPIEMTAEATDDVLDEQTADGTESAISEAAPDDGAAFLAELTRAMQATAGVERKRLEEDAERRRETHLEAIRARRESEAGKMRELAADDLKAIDDWAEEERQRISQEREQRAAALQEDLETSLAEHGSKIDREIDAVDAAIVAYRTEVDAFFAELDKETDPVEIARHAGRRPSFPDLDAVSAAESGTPAAEPGQAAVGVMAPQTAGDLADAWSRWNETAARVGVAADGTAGEGAAPAPTGSLLQSVPVNRPFANLSGERHEE
jgi:hypothetical protein